MIVGEMSLRGTGKTTKALEEFRVSSDVLYIAHFKEAVRDKFSPEELKRVVVMKDFKDDPSKIVRMYNAKKVVIDEGFLMQPNEMAEFYYKLGRANVDVFVVGTPLEKS